MSSDKSKTTSELHTTYGPMISPGEARRTGERLFTLVRESEVLQSTHGPGPVSRSLMRVYGAAGDGGVVCPSEVVHGQQQHRRHRVQALEGRLPTAPQ